MVPIVVGHAGYIEDFVDRFAKSELLPPPSCLGLGFLGCWSGIRPEQAEPEGYEPDGFPNPAHMIGWSSKKGLSEEGANTGEKGGDPVTFNQMMAKAFSSAETRAKKMAEDCKCKCNSITVYTRMALN